MLVVMPLTVVFWLAAATLAGLYRRDARAARHSTADDVGKVTLLVTLGSFGLLELAAATGREAEAGALAALWATAIVAILCARRAARGVVRRHPAFRERALILGSGPQARLLARKFQLHREYGIDPLGFISEQTPRLGQSTDDDGLPVLGGMDHMAAIVERHGVGRVIVGSRDVPDSQLLARIRHLREHGVHVDVLPRLFPAMGPNTNVHIMGGLPLVGLAPVRLSRGTLFAKRTVDVIGSSIALLVASPLFAILAILIKLDSPGPVFFRQNRLTKDQREFQILKFRTMRTGENDAAHREYIANTLAPGDTALSDGGLYKLDRSDVVTRVGSWLRRTSIDELPQLLNVLRGDMSLVGPRPCLPYEVEHFEERYLDRFLVPAGLTGLWQVTARARSTFGEALELDVLYAHSCSLGLDLHLLIRTPLQMLGNRVTA
jgi:exopolysaccharide biosynthesis polyprenyl glycosylphosphotransferase